MAIVESIAIALSVPDRFCCHKLINAEKMQSNLELIIANLYSNVFVVELDKSAQ
ncbi:MULTISPECIES: hypothetical protein [unclassified Microcoleus]|uniref:hypothetical protein n=1 Tax=unclassified Microcoleus TaxID=2642155 RepID=UPI002FCF5550